MPLSFKKPNKKGTLKTTFLRMSKEIKDTHLLIIWNTKIKQVLLVQQVKLAIKLKHNS